MKSILIIGGGSIGKRHLRNLLALGEKDVSMVEIDSERADKIREEFKISVFASADEAWRSKKFIVAFICSPSVYHIEQSFFCAEEGCDIFIEKPLSNSIDGIDELLSVARNNELITMVGSNWKFYPLFQKMKELIDAGEIGKILSARCQSGQYLPDWHPWEDYRHGYSANKKLGGGMLLDSHEFDYLSWFLGDVIKLSCFAKKVSNLEIDVEDVAEVILEFKNGAIGEIHLDYLQRFPQRNFEFFGETGTIIWDNNLKKVVLKNKEKGETVFSLPTDYDINDMYIDEVKHFLNCVEKRRETVFSAAAGQKVLNLILAAKKSAAEDKTIFI